MTTIAAPDLRLVGWRMGIAYPGQNIVTSRLTGRIDSINRGAGLWAGQVAWHINASAPRDRANATRWLAQVQGQTNQTQIDLPRGYGAQSAPSSDYAATVGSVSRPTGGGVDITLTVSAGSWTPSTGDHLNIDNRLYCIEAISGSTLSIAPHAAPTQGATVRVASPYVVVTATEPEQLALAFTGASFAQLAVDWVEHIE